MSIKGDRLTDEEFVKLREDLERENRDATVSIAFFIGCVIIALCVGAVIVLRELA